MGIEDYSDKKVSLRRKSSVRNWLQIQNLDKLRIRGNE